MHAAQFRRKLTKELYVGNVRIGGGASPVIQSMNNTDTHDVARSLEQIRALAKAGCQITRLAVPDQEAASAMREIVADSPIPVVADIHFDYRLALASIRSGVHAIRINPGNIGSPERVKAVVEAAGEAGIPLRVGANSGSLPKGLFESKRAAGLDHDDALAEALFDAAMEQVRLLESYGFDRIKVSLKASSVPVTIRAYRLFSARSDYPLHIGVTEAGTPYRGIIKSALGIGTLLSEGIGDTLRVSLTADPLEEIRAAIAILEAAGLREANPEIVSCPSCGRTAYDLFAMVEKVEAFLNEMKSEGIAIPLRKIAVMGCVVNGPGEAKDAELGIAGGGGPNPKLMLFKYGVPIATLAQEEALERLKYEIMNFKQD